MLNSIEKNYNSFVSKTEIADTVFDSYINKIIQNHPALETALKEQEENLDEDGFNHVINSTKAASSLGEYLNLSNQQRSKLVQAALLHDYGKTEKKINGIFLSDKLLADMTDKEKQHIKDHVTQKKSWMEDNNFDQDVIDIVLSHHEPHYRRNSHDRRIDRQTKTSHDIPFTNERNGSRRREKSEELKYLIHLFKMIDKSDAMTQKRSYKKERDPYECLEDLKDIFPGKESENIIRFLLDIH